MNNRWRYDSPS